MHSILLVEDHTIFASVLVRMLHQTDDLKVTQLANTAEAALQLLPDSELDLVIVDVFLPSMNGIDLVALIHEQYPELPCLMLSGHMLRRYVESSLKAGASGYVLKDNPMGILAGIRHVLKGETYISRELRDE